MTGASFKGMATFQWFNSRAGSFVRAFYAFPSLPDDQLQWFYDKWLGRPWPNPCAGYTVVIASGLIAWWFFPSELMARWRHTTHPNGQVANLVGGTASGVALLSVASFALALVC